MPYKLKILSIDGGGIRGLIPAMLLEEIERNTGRKIWEMFDLIAGTSTGGIISLALTAPDKNGDAKYSAKEIVELYSKRGQRIFPVGTFQKITNYHALKNLFEERYPHKNLEKILKDYLGDTRLKDSLTNVLVTSYEIEHRIPWFFKSRNAKNRPETHDFLMRDIGRATSAAPTYFEPAFIKRPDKEDDYWALIDGGIFANNPAMCALVEGLSMGITEDVNEVLLVSLGTGELNKAYDYSEVKEWGYLGWARPALDIAFHGVSNTIDYQLSKIMLEDNYFRLQTKLKDEQNEMDNARRKNIKHLGILAERLIREERKRINQLCKLLTADFDDKKDTKGRSRG